MSQDKDHGWVDELLGDAHAAVLRAEGMPERDLQAAMDAFWFDDEPRAGAVAPDDDVMPRAEVEKSFDAVRRSDVFLNPKPGDKIRILPGYPVHFFSDEKGKYPVRCTGEGCFLCDLKENGGEW